MVLFRSAASPGIQAQMKTVNVLALTNSLHLHMISGAINIEHADMRFTAHCIKPA